MTNREYFESLDDRQLAKFLIKRKVCCICYYYKYLCTNSKAIAHLDCAEGVAKWLNQEHVEASK